MLSETTHNQTRQNSFMPLTPVLRGVLQRKCACGTHTMSGGQCAECQKKNMGVGGRPLQTKLAISELGDVYELEADRVADQVMAAPARSAISGATFPRIQRFTEQPTGQTDIAPASVDRVLSSAGRSLEVATQRDMEQRFDQDFSQVRIHTGPAAEQSAREVNAHAYTVGPNIVFGAGQLSPGTHEGRRLIAHELSHVVQQSGLNETRVDPSYEKRGLSPISGVSPRSDSLIAEGKPMASVDLLFRQPSKKKDDGKPKINYRRAKMLNIENAKRNNLGWESKLDVIAGGAYKAWANLWANEQYDAFADAVAEFQRNHGWPAKSLDGVLGLKTWSIVAGLGEAIAGIRSVKWDKSETVCTMATKERIQRGHQLASGKGMELGREELTTFSIILQSVPNRMLDVGERFRGAGAAGAMVYAGMGEFVSEADIWAGQLKPGAVIQGWWHHGDYDLLRAGEVAEGKEKRRLRDTDISILAGSSMVFVRYDTETNERILVRHFGKTEWKSKSDFEVWVAANVN